MNSIRPFLAGIVDYAGLFPPASLDMATAVRNYAEYRSGEECDLLGRFVLPAARLGEFSDSARAFLGRGGDADPWRLSVLAKEDLTVAREAMLDFNCKHWTDSELGYAVCDSVEIKVRNEEDVAAGVEVFSGAFSLFFEIPIDSPLKPLLSAVANGGAAAKVRTGGVIESAFPPSASIVRFIAACNELHAPFKATAGLHHAIRATYPLTYDPDSSCAPMFGYLNLFLAAAFIRQGMSETDAIEVLEERSPAVFVVSDGGVSWKGRELSAGDLRGTRAELARSFGSCSFREPVEEARALHLL